MSLKLDGKLIFNPKVAKFLVSRGCRIIDLKPHKQDKTTIFVFEFGDALDNALIEWKNTKPA